MFCFSKIGFNFCSIVLYFYGDSTSYLWALGSSIGGRNLLFWRNERTFNFFYPYFIEEFLEVAAPFSHKLTLKLYLSLEIGLN